MTVLPVLLAAAAAATAAAAPAGDRLVRVLPPTTDRVPVWSGRASVGRWSARPRTPRGDARVGPVRVPVVRRLCPLLAGVVAALVRGPAAGALAVLAVVLLARTLAARAGRARAVAERTSAVEACAALSAELRAGREPSVALAVAAEAACGPVASALHEAAGAARLGGDVPAALLRRLDSTAAPGLVRGLAACWRVCSTTGGGLAGAVDRLTEGLQQAEAQRRDVEAELAGPRATAALLAGLPLAGVALAAALGAAPVHVLLDTPAGAVCLVSGTALDLLGVWWTSRIVASAQGP